MPNSLDLFRTLFFSFQFPTMKLFAYFAVITLSSASLIDLLKRATTNECSIDSCYKASQTLWNKCGDGISNFKCLCDLPQSYFQDLYDCSNTCGTLQESDIHSPSDIKQLYCDAASNNLYTFSIPSISLDMINYTDFETDTESTTEIDTRSKTETGTKPSGSVDVAKTLQTGGASSTANSETKSGSGTTSKASSTSVSEAKTASGSSSSGKSSSATSASSTQQTTSLAGAASGTFVSLLGLFAALLI